MKVDMESTLGFREEILPNLEALLHHSLTLTQNGHDAVGLLSEVMAVAYRTWDESMPQRDCRVWLRNMVTNQFQESFGKGASHRTPISDAKVAMTPAGTDRRNPAAVTGAWQSSFLTGEWENEVHYFETLAGLPEVFRSAMILSYFEGFSSSAVADLVGAEPRTVIPSLTEGRRFIREELFSQLMDHDGLGKVSDLKQRR